ncbi:MAG: hypothetical protein LBV22_03735 [Mycoplasmataceae bacterium]|nr:hypothetical protein [Mycoplasmataceae bacterium]
MSLLFLAGCAGLSYALTPSFFQGVVGNGDDNNNTRARDTKMTLVSNNYELVYNSTSKNYAKVTANLINPVGNCTWSIYQDKTTTPSAYYHFTVDPGVNNNARITLFYDRPVLKDTYIDIICVNNTNTIETLRLLFKAAVITMELPNLIVSKNVLTTGVPAIKFNGATFDYAYNLVTSGTFALTLVPDSTVSNPVVPDYITLGTSTNSPLLTLDADATLIQSTFYDVSRVYNVTLSSSHINEFDFTTAQIKITTRITLDGGTQMFSFPVVVDDFYNIDTAAKPDSRTELEAYPSSKITKSDSQIIFYMHLIKNSAWTNCDNLDYIIPERVFAGMDPMIFPLLIPVTISTASHVSDMANTAYVSIQVTGSSPNYIHYIDFSRLSNSQLSNTLNDWYDLTLSWSF